MFHLVLGFYFSLVLMTRYISLIVIFIHIVASWQSIINYFQDSQDYHGSLQSKD